MPTQMLLSLTSSMLNANQVIDWLKHEGFAAHEISACLPEVKSAPPRSASQPRPKGASLCGPITWNSCTRRVTVLGQRLLDVAGTFSRTLSQEDSLAGILVSRGIPQAEAQRYEIKIQNGGILISLHTGSAAKLRRAKKIFELAGMEDISAIRLGGRGRTMETSAVAPAQAQGVTETF